MEKGSAEERDEPARILRPWELDAVAVLYYILFY
jgi:hypothetical protein